MMLSFYRWNLRLLPGSLRNDHEDEMLTMVRERLQGRNGLRWTVAYLAELADLYRTVIRERLPHRRMDRNTVGRGGRDLGPDLRYVLRSLRRRPGYALVIITTLAIGIGANTTMFTLVNSVVLRPLPLPGADRLVYGFGAFSLNASARISPPDYLDYRERVGALESLAAFQTTTTTVEGEGQAEQIRLGRASANLFSTLGLTPAVGRAFAAGEDEDGAPLVAVLSEAYWRRSFGGQDDVVGRDIILGGDRHRIIGVLPADMAFVDASDVWIPMPFHGANTSIRRFHFLRVVGRLAPDVSIAAAQDEVNTVAAELAAVYPTSNDGWTMRLVSLQDAIIGPAGSQLLILMGAVLVVMLIVCANVSGLMLVRSHARRREMAIRAALGASSRRIGRLLLLESLTLSLVGGALGLYLGSYLLDLALQWSAGQLPRAEEIALDTPVVLFSLVLATASGLLFGWLPARKVARQGLVNDLVGSRGSVSDRGGAGRVMVVAQVALSLVLLTGAGLLLRTVWSLDRVDPGFVADPVLTVALTLPGDRYDSGEPIAAYHEAIIARLEAVPGIDAVSSTNILPMSGSYNDTAVYPAGARPEPGGMLNAQWRLVDENFFEVMGIPLLAGRDFDGRDLVEGTAAIVISDSLAGVLFPEQEVLGREIALDFGEEVVLQVVGVVDDVLMAGLGAGSSMAMYVLARQHPTQLGRGMRLVVKTSGDPVALAPTVRAAVREVDPRVAVSRLRPMREYVDGSVRQPRFRALLLSAFAGVALLLSLLGIYGLLAHFVSQRTREIGVRMALGATPTMVLRLVVGRGMMLLAAGVGVGLVGAWGATRLLRTMLFGVAPTDPVSYLTVVVVFGVVALLASIIPGRRAANVDPLEAIRTE